MVLVWSQLALALAAALLPAAPPAQAIICNCFPDGTSDGCDDVTGQCFCKTFFAGERCDHCVFGYRMLVHGREHDCVPCNCSPMGWAGSSPGCSADGTCDCLPNYSGKLCDQCAPGHDKYPDCL